LKASDPKSCEIKASVAQSIESSNSGKICTSPSAMVTILGGVDLWNLSRIELGHLSIEPGGMNGLGLHGIDAPLPTCSRQFINLMT